MFAKYRFPGRTLPVPADLATAIVPFESYMIPLYLQLNAIGWINTYQGDRPAHLFMSFGIFLHAPAHVVGDSRRAAGGGADRRRVGVVDLAPGASRRSRCSALSAIGIFAFIQAWAAFIWPLLVANDQLLFNMEVGLTGFQFRFSRTTAS